MEAATLISYEGALFAAPSTFDNISAVDVVAAKRHISAPPG